jgi:hypothetical protein
MASVMLATYPELFAGGAVIAGLPYGCATSVQEAFEAMFNECAPSSRALGDRVRGATPHRGPWPKISVWHGTADTVVRPSNADHIIRQWLDVQNLSQRSPSEDRMGRHIRRIWKDANGDTRLESYSIVGMGHGVPLATTGADSCGVAGPFFLDAGISSTSQIARFWELDRGETRERQPATRAATGCVVPPARLPAALHLAEDLPPHEEDRPRRMYPNLDPNAVIAAAFKAAGLSALEPDGRPGSRMVEPDAIIAAALKSAGLTRE